MASGWQEIQAEALRRIQSRQWPPGSLIPNEAALAAEFDCARSTVNRALQALADAGLLERRRKAGTRVATAPQRRAQLAIPLIRQEIAASGARPSHGVILHRRATMPADLRLGLGLPVGAPTMETATLHMADGRPYALEWRWVNLITAPGYQTAPLDRISANEWLVQNIPFAHGTLDYVARPAGDTAARHLGCAADAAVMVLERRTFAPEGPVTFMRLTHGPGHRLHLQI
jgi:GntR family histidine utilization transcriptional repressor